MRILIISSFLPFPLHSGGHVRLYNLIKELSKDHKITLICEKRDYQTQKDIVEVKKICEDVITVERKKQWSGSNVVKTAVSAFPFLLVGHSLPEMKNRIVDILKNKKFDIIHVETFYVYQNLPKTYLPVVLAEHNIEYQVYEKFMRKTPVFVRPFLSVDIQKIKYWEEKVWKEVAKLIAVSEQDKVVMKRSDVVVVPNGVDLGSFPFKKKILEKKVPKKSHSSGRLAEKTILFMGDFKWIQNQQAVKFIISEIWPEIESRIKNQELCLKLWIVGKHIPENLKKLQTKTIIFDEHAPEKTSDIYKKADILLAPIQVGGGTSYKIIEAMASGVPVVTTPLGVKGLGAKPGNEGLVSERAEDLAEDVVSLLNDNILYEKVRTNARKFIETHFDWKVIARTLENVYRDAVKENE